MNFSKTLTGSLRQAAHASLIATLCVTTAAPEAFAAAPAKVPSHTHSSPLTKNEKTLHALNRLTFGPRQGDAAAVEKEGLDTWFERQLHPDKIDDSAFEKRLDEYPALKLTQTQLIDRFPSPNRMKSILLRGGELPKTNDPVQQAIWADSVARYRYGLARAAGNDDAAQPAAAPAAKMSGDMSGEMAMDSAAPAGRKAAARENLVTDTKNLPVSTLTPEQIREVVQLPADQRFQRIVAMSPADNVRLLTVMQSRLPLLMDGFTPQQREDVLAMMSPARVVAAEALEARLLRDTYSERQVQAVLTDFWLNHFSVYVKKNQYQPYLLNSYERDTVLPNALGNFEQLLIATAKSPAMLRYLDNWESIGPNSPSAARIAKYKKRFPDAEAAKRAPEGINENYARELMELHTVGVNGGYTQKDVIEVAKCFTGWTVSGSYRGGDDTFRFDPSRHEPGPKVVMGVTIPEGGMQEGLTVLHMLATSPKTAHFISQKLAVRFVADNPSPALVDRMAATFLKSNGNIPAVLSTMFHSPEFWSPQVYRAKIKTPVEFMVSALRASDTQVTNPLLLVQAVDRLGMPIYGMQTPNGYSWQSADWVSSGALVNRMNFALVLSGDHIPGADTQWSRLLGDQANSNAPSAQTEKKLELAILGEPASVRTRDTVLDQFNKPGVQQDAQKNFGLTADTGEERGNSMAGNDKPAARYKRSKLNYRGTSFSFNSTQPETPLDTMAGLLLGSPDFQRR